jgi:hypothetical protein
LVWPRAKIRQAVSSTNSRVQVFSENDISVLLPDKTGNMRFAHLEHNRALEGAAVVSGSGIVLGGALSCLMALGILAIPGVGPLIAAGPIIAAFAGTGLVQ